MNMKIVVGICTRRRRRMLDACLLSVIRQETAKNFEIVVVENDTEPRSKDVIESYRSARLHYELEPVQGISRARNRVLQKAIELGATHVAFIDDDEYADQLWLESLTTNEYIDTPVLQGIQCFVYPETPSFWCVDRRNRNVKTEGRSLRTAVTNNVRFSLAIVNSGIWFDESIELGGGEDVDFFTRAHAAGFEIRSTNRAITYEWMHAERLTYFAQIARSYWCGAADIRAMKRTKGARYTWARKFHTAIAQPIIGVVELAISPLFIVASVDAFKRRALAGGKKIGKGLGRLAGLIDLKPQPYKRVVGC